MRRGRTRIGLLATAGLIGLVALARVAYGPVMGVGFLGSDFERLSDDRGPDPAERPVEARRPLADALLRLDLARAGLDPAAFRFTSLVLLGLAALALGLFVAGFVKPPGRGTAGTLAAIAFVLVAVNVQAVAWISARSVLPATALAFGALALYDRWIERQGLVALLLALSLSVGAVLANEQALLLPAIVPILALARRSPHFSASIAVAALAVAAGVLVRVALERNRGAGVGVSTAGPRGEASLLLTLGRVLVPLHATGTPEGRRLTAAAAFVFAFGAAALLAVSRRRPGDGAAASVLGLVVLLAALPARRVLALDPSLSAARFWTLPAAGVAGLLGLGLGRGLSKGAAGAASVAGVVLFALASMNATRFAASAYAKASVETEALRAQVARALLGPAGASDTVFVLSVQETEDGAPGPGRSLRAACAPPFLGAAKPTVAPVRAGDTLAGLMKNGRFQGRISIFDWIGAPRPFAADPSRGLELHPIVTAGVHDVPALVTIESPRGRLPAKLPGGEPAFVFSHPSGLALAGDPYFFCLIAEGKSFARPRFLANVERREFADGRLVLTARLGIRGDDREVVFRDLGLGGEHAAWIAGVRTPDGALHLSIPEDFAVP